MKVAAFQIKFLFAKVLKLKAITRTDFSWTLKKITAGQIKKPQF